ncbi:hypothetical protein TVAG_150120 [Trichomonas vaginalis G3]|uniref:AAA+ ATPase domain-containing protein n=1 Tax=Trichomonas vaginalis (strain ATCC PRA-98 / G3) TaxID=412133 RepID=A2DRR4_TRIV3|nr:P-loop containing nucleoside triphosphate hydrolases family [Trichomonas vaginalis G3]EAY16861.1 hypothetical protein TVAG_150120 [Trichomonas vaginalis G3]KAI5489152.1 P-loop containing nucleoside triphosphate hydrolases family [Trichomonas vaginalis G3]|eukprot:XP_001329084.1 hypothetical protein [Trichomonas vaginalis G3]
MRPSNQQQGKDKSRRKLIIGSIIIILIAAVIIYFWRPFRRYEAQFPYFWANSYNRTIINYLNKRPSRQVLYITGPTQSGKSRSMNIVAQNLTEKGRFVLNLDGENFWPLTSLSDWMHTAILRGLIEVKPYLPKDRLSQLYEKKKNQLNNAKLPALLDPQLGQVYHSLTRSLSNIPDKNHISTFAVSQFIDKLEYYRNSLQPVIMIHNFDKLYNNATLPLYDAILSRLARRNLYLDHVPIILEVRDTLFLKKFGDLLPLLDICYTEEVPPHLTEVLYQKKYFTKSEWRKLYKNFGGNMGLFQKVYNDLLFGTNIDQAINNRVNEAFEVIKNDVPKETSSQARQLCRNDLITYSPDLDPLIQKGYLLLNKNSTVHVGNRAIKKALCMK